MATTRIYHSTPSKDPRFARLEERMTYSAMWGLLAIALMAAIAYGYLGNNDANLPRDVGASAHMIHHIVSPELTPSIMAPGTPDTTTTESSAIPVEGVR